MYVSNKMSADSEDMLRRRRPDDNVDWGDVDNEYYTHHFEKLDDDIADQYNEVICTDYYIYNLPSSMIDGLPILQERIVMPIKVTPLFSELKKGTYENSKSKYDTTNTWKNIQFYVRNLPSFKKYAKKDQIDWVVTQRRRLAMEIFAFYKDDNPSLSTLEYRLNGILRMMRICYGNKTRPVYKLFSEVVFQIHDFVVEYDGENALNKHEEKKHINWQDVLTVQKNLEEEFNAMPDKHTVKAYDLNSDLLLLSMYCLIPPLRNEIKMLDFKNSLENKVDDYVYISPNKDHIILVFNKIKKLHRATMFDLSRGKCKNEHLERIIKQSYELYPRDYLFTLKQRYPDVSSQASIHAMNSRLFTIFFKAGIKNQITVNSLRSSYATYALHNVDLTTNNKKIIVDQMRSSVNVIEASYRKVINKPPVLTPVEKPENKQIAGNQGDTSMKEPTQDAAVNTSASLLEQEPTVKPLNQYEKKLQRERDYYYRNKERLTEYQREYNKKKSAFDKSRDRLLQLLNASEDYCKKMKDATKEKYKFVYDETKKRWQCAT